MCIVANERIRKDHFSMMMSQRIVTLGGFSLSALSLALAQTFAQTPDASDLDRVIVTGIRGSLESSLNLKRDSQGVVDGIIAEDIGKFPDTNLAESLQRISGVSINRTNTGEGSQVTVRGVGPAFNLVLLNGRQMPNTVSNSRAFDFSNLASEAVSKLEVYKTSHADTPTGGIGATINIKTARPLARPGLHASVGVKGVMDTTADNLPHSMRGKSVTPEVSGIFSNTFADGRLGVGVSYSYQERESGYSQAGVTSGWPVFPGHEGESLFARLPLLDEPGYTRYDITNRPGPDDLYGRPQNFELNVTSQQRQRRNGQVVLQFAPTDTITASVDYTRAENRIQRQRSEMMVWFDFLPGRDSFTDGPVAGPIIYSEYVTQASPKAFTHAGTQDDVRNELKSLGFNVEWQVTDHLDMTLDYHDSRAQSRPDSPFGSSRRLGSATWFRGDTSIDFSSELPVLTVNMAPGIEQIEPSHMRASNSIFRNDFNHSQVQQWQASGIFRFAGYQALDFGAARTKAYNRTASVFLQRNTAVGATRPDGTPSTQDDYDDDIWQVDHMGKYFKQFSGHDDPRFTDRFMIFDFARLHQRVIEVTGRPDWYTAPTTFTTDRRTFETSNSAWLQWRNTFDWKLPVNVAAGVRYEKTDVVSPAQIFPPATNVEWLALNEMDVTLSQEPVETRGTGEYHYWLPNLDIRVDLRDNLVLRGSVGKSIGRAGWGNLLGGRAIGARVRVEGGTGNRGNPGLLPLESKNFDLSLEWYYAEGSYAAIGYFRKNIRNFISTAIIEEQPYEVHTPVGGEFWNEAVNAGGCSTTNLSCIRNYIFTHHADDPSVNRTGQTGEEITGVITGRASDPIVTYSISMPTNQRSDYLDGFEVNLQHMLGQTGFGVAANYTKVNSGLTYNNNILAPQSPMAGLSDSANLVVFYENQGWRVRAAYNWRDKFLSGIGGGGFIAGVTNPNYTERFGQLDMNITWEKDAHLAFFVEGINLSNETMRVHGRHKNMLVSAIQTGPRYLFGVRYKF